MRHTHSAYKIRHCTDDGTVITVSGIPGVIRFNMPSTVYTHISKNGCGEAVATMHLHTHSVFHHGLLRHMRGIACDLNDFLKTISSERSLHSGQTRISDYKVGEYLVQYIEQSDDTTLIKVLEKNNPDCKSVFLILIYGRYSPERLDHETFYDCMYNAVFERLGISRCQIAGLFRRYI